MSKKEDLLQTALEYTPSSIPADLKHQLEAENAWLEFQQMHQVGLLMRLKQHEQPPPDTAEWRITQIRRQVQQRPLTETTTTPEQETPFWSNIFRSLRYTAAVALVGLVGFQLFTMYSGNGKVAATDPTTFSGSGLAPIQTPATIAELSATNDSLIPLELAFSNQNKSAPPAALVGTKDK